MGRHVKLLAAWAAQAGEGTKRRHNRAHASVEHQGLEPRAAQGPLHTEQPGAWAA